MNRAGFLKELRSSLIQTSYETAEPLMSEDVSRAKVQWLTMQGYEWWPVHGFNHKDGVYWVYETAFLVKMIAGEWQALVLSCPACLSLLHYQKISQQTTCFSCNREWKDEDAVKQLDPRPVIFIDQNLHILHKKKR